MHTGELTTSLQTVVQRQQRILVGKPRSQDDLHRLDLLATHKLHRHTVTRLKLSDANNQLLRCLHFRTTDRQHKIAGLQTITLRCTTRNNLRNPHPVLCRFRLDTQKCAARILHLMSPHADHRRQRCPATRILNQSHLTNSRR